MPQFYYKMRRLLQIAPVHSLVLDDIGITLEKDFVALEAKIFSHNKGNEK